MDCFKKESQAGLALIQMGWKQWLELKQEENKNEAKDPTNEWLRNLYILGFVRSGEEVQVVFCNVEPRRENFKDSFQKCSESSYAEIQIV